MLLASKNYSTKGARLKGRRRQALTSLTRRKFISQLYSVATPYFLTAIVTR